MLKRILFIVVLPLLLITFLGSQNKIYSQENQPGEISLIGKWPPSNIPNLSIKDLATSDNYIFAIGNYLRVLDISKPTIPEHVSSLYIPGNAFRIIIEFEYAYILSDNGLTICDISSPNDPKIVGSFSTSTKPADIAIYKNYLYITLKNKKWILILDVSNPYQPNLVTSPHFPKNIAALKILNDVLYLGSRGGYYAYDVSNPLFPKSKGSISSGKYPIDLEILQNYAVVLGKHSPCSACEDYYSMSIFSISNIEDITQVDWCELGTDLINTSINLDDEYLYLVIENNLKISNLTDISNTKTVATYYFDKPFFIKDLYLMDDYFIVTDSRADLYIYNKPDLSPFKVRVEEDENISVHYSNNYILFKLSSDYNYFKIYDINGRIVYSSQGEMEIKFSGFKGIYIYEVVWANGERETGKIMRW